MKLKDKKQTIDLLMLAVFLVLTGVGFGIAVTLLTIR